MRGFLRTAAALAVLVLAVPARAQDAAATSEADATAVISSQVAPTSVRASQAIATGAGFFPSRPLELGAGAPINVPCSPEPTTSPLCPGM